MHELGIIIHLNKTLHSIAREQKLVEIASVTLEIGEVSAIVPHYLSDCWLYYREKFPLIKHAKLIMETIPARTYCEDCEQQYETITYGKICPYCQSEHTYLVAGDECIIKEIEA